MIRKLTPLLLLLIAACAPTVSLDSLEDTTIRRQITAMIGGVMIGVDLLPGWEAFIDNRHVTLVEKPTEITDSADTALTGTVVNFWMPSLTLETDEAPPAVSHLLSDHLDQSNLHETAEVSTPSPFVWEGHDAAYYMLNTGDGNLTLVVAVMISPEIGMMAVNITGPMAHREQIMNLLPVLFANFSINGKSFDPAVFEDWADRAAYPVYPSDDAGTD